jgi:hypothetical protein
MHLLIFPILFVLLAFVGFLSEHIEISQTAIQLIVGIPFLLFIFIFFLRPAYYKSAGMIRNNTTIPEIFVPIVTIFTMIAFFVVAFIALLLVIITAGYLLGAIQSFVRGFIAEACTSED